jgi:hypothetical protein
MRGRAALLAVVVACGCADVSGKGPDAPGSPPPMGEDWYPADITPPEGTRYPCALTALPRDLPGIPAADRTYVNHVYSLLLRATQEKLRLLKTLEQAADIARAHARYEKETGALAERLGREPVPAGLQPFHDDVLAALELQRAFFTSAVAQRAAGRTMGEVYSIPQGRQASSKLIGAWGAMERRYPAWPAETRDSVYHHLCALDLF